MGFKRLWTYLAITKSFPFSCWPFLGHCDRDLESTRRPATYLAICSRNSTKSLTDARCTQVVVWLTNIGEWWSFLLIPLEGLSANTEFRFGYQEFAASQQVLPVYSILGCTTETICAFFRFCLTILQEVLKKQTTRTCRPLLEPCRE